jgi:hypothetical protein
MTQARGHNLALRFVDYLQGFIPTARPGAKNVRAGKAKVDVTGTPGLIFEVKTPRDFRPTEWALQARGYVRDGELPIVIYFPERIGAGSIDDAIAMLPVGELMRLLVDSGRIPAPF